jgi:hypothetical protein
MKKLILTLSTLALTTTAFAQINIVNRTDCYCSTQMSGNSVTCSAGTSNKGVALQVITGEKNGQPTLGKSIAIDGTLDNAPSYTANGGQTIGVGSMDMPVFGVFTLTHPTISGTYDVIAAPMPGGAMYSPRFVTALPSGCA